MLATNSVPVECKCIYIKQLTVGSSLFCSVMMDPVRVPEKSTFVIFEVSKWKHIGTFEWKNI